MARARTVRLEEIDGDEPSKVEQDKEDLQDADEMEGGDLFAALDEMRGTAGVNFIIVRTFPSTPDMAGYVGSLTPAEFSLERMTELYGPGKYRVRVKGPKGWLPGGGTVAIAKGVDRPTPATGSGGDFATFLKTVQERDAAAAARRDRYIELAIPGAITLLAAVLGKNTAPDYTALIAALKPAPGPSITELTTALAGLKNLTEAPKAEGGTQLESFLTILEKVKDLSDGEGKGASTWVDIVRDVIKEGLPMAKPLLENLQAQQQAHAASRVPLPLPPMTVQPIATVAVPSSTNGESVSPSSTPAEGSDMLAIFMPMIRAELTKLLKWAEEDKRIELYAEVLLEELPATVHKYVTPQQALQHLNNPQWFEILTNLDARLMPHRAWCDEMRQELISIIEDQLREKPDAPEQITDPLNGEGNSE